MTAQREIAASTVPTAQHQRRPNHASAAGLRHAVALALTGLGLCVLLVAAGCLVNLGWESNHVLAVLIVAVLVAGAGGGVALLMSRPARPARRR